MAKRKTTKQSRWFATGQGIAAKYGLYLFETGAKDDPQWSVMSLRTGKTLATYYPASGRWLCGDEKGTEPNWRRVFAKAIEFDAARQGATT
jgi:hypothetical protein